jgi:hypothetical protein
MVDGRIADESNADGRVVHEWVIWVARRTRFKAAHGGDDARVSGDE